MDYREDGRGVSYWKQRAQALEERAEKEPKVWPWVLLGFAVLITGVWLIAALIAFKPEGSALVAAAGITIVILFGVGAIASWIRASVVADHNSPRYVSLYILDRILAKQGFKLERRNDVWHFEPLPPESAEDAERG